MSQKTKTSAPAPIDETLGYKVPETSSILSTIKEALKAEHKQEEEEDDKAGKPKKKRPPQQCCCCGNPSCGIGPFTETQGEDVE